MTAQLTSAPIAGPLEMRTLAVTIVIRCWTPMIGGRFVTAPVKKLEVNRVIKLTERGMASYTPAGLQLTEYYTKSCAAQMAGMHEDSLGRIYRQSGMTAAQRVGLHLWNMTFFTASHMESLLKENPAALEKFRKSMDAYHGGSNNGK